MMGLSYSSIDFDAANRISDVEVVEAGETIYGVENTNIRNSKGSLTNFQPARIGPHQNKESNILSIKIQGEIDLDHRMDLRKHEMSVQRTI